MTTTNKTVTPARKPKGHSKHVPQRTCCVCRRTDAKRTLHRLVRTPHGVHYDPTSKANGRGAYLCNDPACWQRALDHGALARALKTTLTPEERTALREALSEAPSEIAQRLTQAPPPPSSPAP